MTKRPVHAGHVALFGALLAVSFLLASILLLALATAMPHFKVQLAASILPLTYALTLVSAIQVFPLVTSCSFAATVAWNSRAAGGWLAGLGLALGFVAQAASALFPTPKDLPIETLLRNPATIWLFAAFGILLAPLCEEVLFRGLLLPAFASAVDYVRLPRSLEALERWRATNDFSPLALYVSTLVSSALFALIHAPQLGYTWPVLLLFFVSIVLCLVRLRTSSVAASTLVHATYNLSVFLTLFFTTHGFRHLGATLNPLH